ncbi:hypothetical protein [Piscinibacter sakaiensis]|uniref:hypothetical protein n=1 Tax=Piscinibacter sakaiensis TaxID=1547922 RepID=UPI003AAF5AAF
MRSICRPLLAALLSCAPLLPAAQGNDVPPTDGAALLKWLQAGSYRQWPKESAPHRSLGPHPTQVIAYLNPPLDRSLAAKAAAHPKGSAAVKELLDGGGKLSGWAVSVKTSADSDGGKGWYWYEILGTQAGSRVVAQANGVPLCFGCHTPGRDFVLIEHPLK